MVTISNYALRERQDGTTFVSLELSGGLEMVQSQTTGRFYATVRKCRVPATFDESLASRLVGTNLDGEIVRVQVDPYQFLNPRTGELMTLNHSYAYRPKGSMELTGVTQVHELV
jgi:hypothetical protein